uniref:GPI mannosyltransferase 1 n=1 Tax=Ciona intestinalis TaxID=7719 RepID=UPI0002B8EFBA|nr:GPI mannosyltransferase 1 [Ciona intestinalis]|eukprot:XP_004225979.1 GPI mannosyltransferase 1 [Ciona intestinalis]
MIMKTFTVYISAFVLRIFLLLYGMWQDLYMKVKFTDVDYFVFSDAAEFVSLGQSPYLRATYRYSPLLAWILVPNIYLTPVWGKLIFIAADFATAYLIQCILELQCVSKKLISLSLCTWLFNPLTAMISCRGNAESILSMIVCCTLYLLFKKYTFLAGILFGLAVHLKIYPVIYILCIFLFLGSSFDNGRNRVVLCELINNLKGGKIKTIFGKLLSGKRLAFFSAFLVCLVSLTMIMYKIYGFPFLEHTYLYHVTRKDIRHNFSVYFYMLYLDPSTLHGLLCFFNQALLMGILSYTHYEDLPFCLFLLTYVFVTFNKVCTSQYFIWYVSLLPFLVPKLRHIGLKKCLLVIILWFVGQGFWLAAAYLLEFEGRNVFTVLWIAVIVFFLINVFIVKWFITNYDFSPVFTSNGVIKPIKSFKTA